MKILVACEESQAVTIAFRNKGHEAYSCDIQDCSGGHPDMRRLMIPLCQELSEKIPIIFEDICKNGGR